MILCSDNRYVIIFDKQSILFCINFMIDLQKTVRQKMFVCKMHTKGKSATQIADELETSVFTDGFFLHLQNICGKVDQGSIRIMEVVLIILHEKIRRNN